MPITKVGFHVVNLGQKRPRRVQELGWIGGPAVGFQPKAHAGAREEAVGRILLLGQSASCEQ
jgi:hypothetical protein